MLVISNANQQFPNHITIDSYKLEVIKEVVYLELLITADNNIREEVERRILLAGRCCYIYYKALIRSALTYR